MSHHSTCPPEKSSLTQATADQNWQTHKEHLFAFLRFNGWFAILPLLVLVYHSLTLPLTWVQPTLISLSLFPFLLFFILYFTKATISSFMKFFLVCCSLLQAGLFLAISCGIFLDLTQTPTLIESKGILTLSPFNEESSDYLIETSKTYQIIIQGDYGSRVLTYPKSKTSIAYDASLTHATVETFSACSHHWLERVINAVTGTHEHTASEVFYQIKLPQTH